MAMRAIRLAVSVSMAVAASAQQFDEMRLRSLSSPRAATRCAVVVDFDGDGDRDVVCGGSNRFYRNRGDGVFVDDTLVALPPSLGGANAMACGDFDGDGDLDLAVAVGWPVGGQDRLLRNDGSGHFTDVTASQLPVDQDCTMAVARGDLDGDGDLDLVFGNGCNEPCRIYANDGTGTFTDVTVALLGSAPVIATSVALDDVDLDGDRDLLLNAPLRLLRNQGGVFADVSSTHVPPGLHPAAIVLADVDADGDSDLHGISAQGSRLLRNSGGVFTDVTVTHLPAGQPSSSGFAASALDIDGDGDLDLVEGTRILRNGGNGVFTAAPAPLPGPGETVLAIAGGDVDGDGDTDLLIGVREFVDGHDHLLLGDGTGAFTDVTPARIPPKPSDTGRLVAGDFDNDGDADLAMFGAVGRLWHNDGNGWFREAPDAGWMQLANPAAAATVLDADSDGDLDIVVACPGPDELLYNDGSGVFTPAPPGALPDPFVVPSAIAGGDFDGDGDVDLVYGTYLYSPIVLDNRGSGRFVATWQIPFAYGPGVTTTLAVGDVDADGDLDIVAGNDGTQNRLYRNTGNGVFVDATASLPADFDATVALALADFDADGDLDLFCGNSWSMAAMSAQDRLYLNDGTGTFTDVTTTALPSDGHAPTHVSVGDIHGDGFVDLVLHGPCPGCAGQRVYRNDGTGRFTDATATDWPAVPRSGSVGLRARASPCHSCRRCGSVASRRRSVCSGSRQC